MTGSGGAVVQHVTKDFSLLLVPQSQRRQLGLRIGTHLGVGLAGKELFGLVELTAELEITAIRDRDLCQRSTLLRERRRLIRVRNDRRIEEHLLNLEKPLVINLELLKHE